MGVCEYVFCLLLEFNSYTYLTATPLNFIKRNLFLNHYSVLS